MTSQKKALLGAVAGMLAFGLSTAAALPLGFRFADDFSQPNGPPVRWTVVESPVTGEALVENGELSLDVNQGPTRADHIGVPEVWVYAGNPVEEWTGDLTVSAHVEFFAHPNNPQSNYGGMVLFASKPGHDGQFNGYTVAWRDVDGGRGYEIHRWDGEVDTLLGAFGGGLPCAGHIWTVTVMGDEISLAVDGDDMLSVEDATYRSGYVGMWLYANAQHAHVDEVVIASALHAEPIDPADPPPGPPPK